MNASQQRRRVGCGAKRPKSELVRMVADRVSGIGVEVTGRRKGRGASLCADSRCRFRTVANGSLARALRSFGVPIHFENDGIVAS